MAHEIRNPLMSIGGFAWRLRKKIPDLHEAEIIVQESSRLEEILLRIEPISSPLSFVRLRNSGNYDEDMYPEIEKSVSFVCSSRFTCIFDWKSI
jgi:hypothetical protein